MECVPVLAQGGPSRELSVDFVRYGRVIRGRRVPNENGKKVWVPRSPLFHGVLAIGGEDRCADASNRARLIGPAAPPVMLSLAPCRLGRTSSILGGGPILGVTRTKTTHYSWSPALGIG